LKGYEGRKENKKPKRNKKKQEENKKVYEVGIAH
jgi:hypothetical protein